jgi:hypothetical protein
MILLGRLSIRRLKVLTQTLWGASFDPDEPCTYLVEVMGAVEYYDEESVRVFVFVFRKVVD